MEKVVYRKININGLDIHYREAGPKKGPAILYCTASHRPAICSATSRRFSPIDSGWLPLICRASGDPTCPPPRTTPTPLRTSLKRCLSLPTGSASIHLPCIFSIMERRSDYAWGCPNTKRITAIISQNGNAYEDGFSDGWHPVRAFWADPNAEHRDALRHILSPDAVFRQYTQGVSNIEFGCARRIFP
jgi:hypothetical protein